MRLLFTLGVALTLACGPSSEPCAVTNAPVPDYTLDQWWVCRPGTSRADCGADLSTTDVLADGSTQVLPSLQPATTPKAACFYVYPTVDVALRTGIHRTFDDLADQVQTTAAQAARLRSICSLHAPLYRQVTLGTYSARPSDSRNACFEVAHADVVAAFDQFLADIGPTQPIVLIGHSQGAQNVSRLLRERFDDGGPLSKRLVAAFPIGWHIATATGSTTGGSYQKLPLCERQPQTGCVSSWRTFAASNPLPDFNPEFAEGEQLVCVNPAGDGDATYRLSGAVFPLESSLVKVPARLGVKTAFVRYPDFFEARCVRDGANAGLQVSAAPKAGDTRTSPIDFDKVLLSGNLGTHVLDLQLPQEDLVQSVKRRVDAFVP